MDSHADLAGLTAQIVAAYVGHNAISPGEVPDLIHSVHRALKEANGALIDGAPIPAVPVKRSITPNYLICLEDGRHFKTLKRHLKTKYDMTPDEYRAKWGLPATYPMVAPNYTKQRSELARSNNLGRSGRPSRLRHKRLADGDAKD